jgi:hypothetical protein
VGFSGHAHLKEDYYTIIEQFVGDNLHH